MLPNRPARMIFMRYRSKCHESITAKLIDRTFVSVQLAERELEELV